VGEDEANEIANYPVRGRGVISWDYEATRSISTARRRKKCCLMDAV
jgi:hypothetical protein